MARVSLLRDVQSRSFALTCGYISHFRYQHLM